MAGGQTMASRPLESVRDRSSEPDLEGNIRKLTRATASVWQAESGGAQKSAGELGALLGEVSRETTGEIDRLIMELQTLQQTLKTRGERIERDIGDYATLSARATQMTTIVSDGMKQLPTRA
jgi:ABC-type transporter Mla subunit MlaD